MQQRVGNPFSRVTLHVDPALLPPDNRPTAVRSHSPTGSVKPFRTLYNQRCSIVRQTPSDGPGQRSHIHRYGNQLTAARLGGC